MLRRYLQDVLLYGAVIERVEGVMWEEELKNGRCEVTMELPSSARVDEHDAVRAPLDNEPARIEIEEEYYVHLILSLLPSCEVTWKPLWLELEP